MASQKSHRQLLILDYFKTRKPRVAIPKHRMPAILRHSDKEIKEARDKRRMYELMGCSNPEWLQNNPMGEIGHLPKIDDIRGITVPLFMG